jgi:Carboxypeptidase regulatory-like domain
MKRAVGLCVLLVGLLGTLSSLHAQTLGTIAGVVKDASDAVLPGVTVEASSPALIEKTRSVVTDGRGQFSIVNLPPGTYNVSFNLTGFAPVNRQGIEVSIAFTATLNITMRVGGVAETVIVSGETPVVDLQSSAQTTVANARAFKELPTGGSWVNMAQIIPAVNSAFFGARDVGGLLGDQTGTQVSVHGGLPGDGVSMIDGMRIGNMYLASNLTNMSLSPLLYDEVNISFSGQTGESGTNGVLMNAIPKSGGNTFQGSLLANGSWPALQGNNVTDRLESRGVQGVSNTIKKLYDINGAIGGPIKRDRVWFYYTSRYFTNEYYMAGQFYPVDPSAFARVEDTSRQAYAGTWTADNNVRITWSPTSKQKVSGWYAYQRKDDPHWLQQILFTSPEATQLVKWPTQLSTITWNYAATNRMLFEAGIVLGESPDTIIQPPELIAGTPIFGLGGPNAEPIFAARSAWFNDFDDHLPSQTYKGSMSYVTGSHNLKVGMSLQHGYFTRNDSNHAQGDFYYLTFNDQPLFVTITSPLAGWTSRLNYNLGIYAQDSWTTRRVNVNAGIRFDFQNESTDAFTATPGPWLPNRNFSYPENKNVPNWKDVNPRLSVSYDLFGNGKTALKASASRSVQQDSIGTAQNNNPGFTTVTSVSRFWLDANQNLVADCDLTNPNPHFSGGDFCDAWANQNFGNNAPATVYDPAILNGWGVRPYNWEFSTGVQHELIPRLSLSAGYFRRILGNFQVTDNTLVTAADYDPYSVIVPVDPRLPNSGQTISSGLYDLDPTKFGQVHNVVTAASDFGQQIEHWDGFDITATGRFSALVIQGGVSSGRRLTDNCEVRAQLPEISIITPFGSPSAITYPFCHVAEPLLTQVKGSASYLLPWWDIRVSGTLQSVTGPAVAANNTYLVTAPGLGRPFSSGSATVNLIEGWLDPQGRNVSSTLYGDRLNQVDLRFTKILRFGRQGTLDLDVDLYNAFNSDAILSQQDAYTATYQNATSVIQPRFLKFQVRWDF